MGVGVSEEADEGVGEGVELPAWGVEGAGGADEAAGYEGVGLVCAGVAVGVDVDVGGCFVGGRRSGWAWALLLGRRLVDAGEEEFLIEARGGEEAVVVDFGHELPRSTPRSLVVTVGGDEIFQELDAFDRVGDRGAFFQVLQDDQVAVGVVFVLDEREPEWGWLGYDEAGVEGGVAVEGLPGGADDVAAALGKVGRYGC